MASSIAREVWEGAQFQGVDEKIAYTLDVSRLGTPSSPVIVVKDEAGDDVTTAVMPVNVPTLQGDRILLSPLYGLTAGVRYRVEVKYTIDGNVLESYFYVQGQE